MKAHASHRRNEHLTLMQWLAELSDRQLSLIMLILAGMICTALMFVDRSFFS